MIFLVVGSLVLFIWAVVATNVAWAERGKRLLWDATHVEEINGINRVGKWYEDRVEELENETRQLAEQIVASGSIRHRAMPLPEPGVVEEYRSDATGLFVEKVDPRDYSTSL